jgi:FkbM family methyltransferase
MGCLTNRMLQAPKQHVVVEANPGLIHLLEANRDRNACKFTVMNRALAYGGETIGFHHADLFLASGVHLSTESVVGVKSITLEDILCERGFEEITLICDIEGSEIDLVDNELACLRDHVTTFIVETHPSLVGPAAATKMAESLQQAGFEIVSDRFKTVVFENKRLRTLQPSGILSAKP